MDPCERVEDAEKGMETPETPEREMELMGNAGCKIQSSAPATKHPDPSVSGQPSPVTKSAAFPGPPSSASGSPAGTDGSAAKEGFPRASQVFTAETDCPVCFDQYSLHRLPKLLGCRHVFCAVCLKLLVRDEAGGWRIICPVCREATHLFGGLICSLRTQEVALCGALADCGPSGEQPAGLDALRPKRPAHGDSSFYQDGDSNRSENKMAAKRLLFLLLFLMLLGFLALLFLYRGLLKWTLCIAIGCGLVVSGVLCWNPTWKCSASWRERERHPPPVA